MSSVGLALRPERYDALTVENIPPKYWSAESELYQSKWWDYRIMHPMQATYHFVDAYKRAYKAAYARRSDSEGAKWLRVFAKEDFLEGASSTRTALWLARQQADEIGCGYDFFCTRAMHYAERRDWTMLPRPQAMYSNKSMFADDLTIAQHVERLWQQKCGTEIMYSTNEFYRVEHFVNNIHQRQHQRMLLDYIVKTPNKVLMLSTFIYEQRLLDEALVETALPNGSALIERARALFV
jgi:uncharacterized protein YqcC (DUF446 family)